MPGRNANGERMIGLCADRVGDWKHLVQEYTQVYMDKTRQWKGNDGLSGCVKECNWTVVRCESFERGKGEMSYHFLVKGKLRIGMRWVKTRPVGGGKESSESE